MARVLLVTPAYPPLPGGGERYAGSLARELVALGEEVTVVTSAATAEADLWRGAGDGTSERIEDGARVIRCPVRPFPGGRTGLMAWRKGMVVLSAAPGDQSAPLARMARAVPRLDGLEPVLNSLPPPDVVHAFNLSWESGILAAADLARRRSLPLALTPFAHFGAGAGDRVALNSTMDHQLAVLRAADRVLVLTEVERRELIDLGVAANRLVVVDSGSDPLPDGWEASAYGRAGASPEPYAVFVGRASADKGALHAVEATLDLRRAGCGLSLVLVGSTTTEFDRLLGGLDREERQAIHPLGLLAEADKHAVISRSRMLLLPSRSDSFGIVLLEAWAHGLPVIGARAGGIPAVIDAEENGLLVDYGDAAGLAAAMKRLLDDTGLATRLGEQGRAKLGRRYTWPGVARRVRAAYREMTGSAG